MRVFVLCVMACLQLVSLSAQIFVQLERSGTLKSVRYGQGDPFVFKLKNDDTGWHQRMIFSIDVEKNRIGFGDVFIHKDSIEAVRVEKKATGARILGTALQAGGANLLLFAGYEAIFRDTIPDWRALTFGVLNIGAGTAIKKIFRRKVFKPGPRKRIRLLDLNFTEPDQ